MAKETATKTKSQTQNVQQEPPRQQQAVAVLQPPRIPYNKIYEERYGISGMQWRALVDAVYPSAKTPEGIILAVSYCQAKNYDVMKKMVHVVPIWSSSLKREAEGVWESVAALRATAFRTGEYAGCEETKFGPLKTKHFEGEVGWKERAKNVQMDLEFPEWAQVTVYRLIQGMKCSFPGPRVSFLGAYGAQGKSEVPNEKWAEGPSYMLEKCAEAAALRKAFPEAIGSTNAAEEMEGRKTDITGGVTIDHEPTPPRPTRQDTKKRAEVAEQQSEEMDNNYRQAMGDESRSETIEHDDETGEVTETNEKQENGPDRTGPANSGTPLPDKKSAPPKEQDKAGTQEEQQIDYEAMAAKIMELVNGVGQRTNLEKIIANRADELETLRTDAPVLYEAVFAVITKKRAWFER